MVVIDDLAGSFRSALGGLVGNNCCSHWLIGRYIGIGAGSSRVVKRAMSWAADDLFPNRIPNNLSDLMSEFCDGASENAFSDEFMVTLLRGLWKYNVRSSPWKTCGFGNLNVDDRADQQDAMRRALRTEVTNFRKPDTEITETLMAMVVAFYRQVFEWTSS